MVLLAFILGGGPLAAQTGRIPSGVVRSGTLSFDGRATAGNFTGVTTTIAGALTGGADLTGARGWVEAPVRTLKTGNDHRDRDLNKSMQSDTFPVIRFELQGVTPVAVHGDSAQVTLSGEFLIHGVRRSVELPATTVFHGDSIGVRADFPLNLKDYRIGGLSRFLGMFRMHPDITVHVDLVFAATATGP